MSSLEKQVVSISSTSELPDVCVTCGMFTDKRIKARYSEQQTIMVESDGTVSTLLGCLLHLLGPIGWLVALSLKPEREKVKKTKQVNKNTRIRIAQCDLCFSQKAAVPISGSMNTDQFMFEAHPRFVSEYTRLNQP